MNEVTSLIGAGALASYLTRDALQKILGPTAEYLGNELKEFTKRRIENIGRIFSIAEKKLGNRINNPGAVPPRVLKAVLNEGSFYDDEIAAEYFGGVLASSRTGSSRDDRGARIAKTIDSLSTYQIRAHYLIYVTLRHLFAGTGLLLGVNERPKMRFFLPLTAFMHAMDFDQSETVEVTTVVTYIFYGLSSENLIDSWRSGDKDLIKKECPDAISGGILCQPSALGAELFLWAFGYGKKPLEHILDRSFPAFVEGITPYIPGALPLSVPHKR